MKTPYIFNKKILLICFMAVLGISTTYAQSDDKEQQVKNLIESKNYVFKAQTVFPLGGRSRILTSSYDMRVLGDSVVTYLPYFGRAYSAPIDPTDGGIDFTSTQYDYKVKENKKGWNITIQPKDTRDARELVLNITNSGYATLMVNSNNRQAISFNGYIEPRK